MRNKIVIIRHGDDPPDDRVHTLLTLQGFACEITRPFASEPLPQQLDQIAGTVLHGGKYNADDHEYFPFLQDEDDWIGTCLENNIPMLGICQGAQQIAYHLGSNVGPLEGEPCEYGYVEVSPTVEGISFLPEPTHFTQAHFHTFDIPAGAVHLATSDTFPNQAFRYGDIVYGLQFHPEVTIEGFRRWQNTLTHMVEEKGAQSRDLQTRLGCEHDEKQADWFRQFLIQLFGAPPHNPSAV